MKRGGVCSGGDTEEMTEIRTAHVERASQGFQRGLDQ